MQNPFDDLLLPTVVKTNLVVKPALEPIRIRQDATGWCRAEERRIDVQVGGMQRFFVRRADAINTPIFANAARAVSPAWTIAFFM